MSTRQPTIEKLLDPRTWRDLSEQVGPGDTLIVRTGPHPGDESRLRVLRTLPGGSVSVALASDADEIIEPDDAPRHLYVCRRDARGPTTWTIAERHRGRFADIWAGPMTIDLCVRAALSQLQGKDSTTWPDLTICGYDLAALRDNPAPWRAAVSDLGEWQPGRSLSVLCPVGYSYDPAGDVWGHMFRSGPPFPSISPGSPSHTYRTVRVANAVLSQFDDGDVRDPTRPPRWKDYQASHMPAVYMVRPRWRVRDLVPNSYPEMRAQSAEPIMSESAKRAYRESEAHLDLVSQIESQAASQGMSRSDDGRAWVPPSKDD
jgi:hypothetical protein